jgi:hypothetical protein
MAGTLGTGVSTTQMAQTTSQRDQMVVDLLQQVEDEAVGVIPLLAVEMAVVSTAEAEAWANILSKQKSLRSKWRRQL